jgi:hypothetical protein
MSHSTLYIEHNLFIFRKLDFEQEYQNAVSGNHGTDMYEHLPWVSEIASECKHVTELGVGWGESTRAFLKHNIELHSYEFAPWPEIYKLFDDAKKSGRNVTLHVEDTRQTQIAETELMLVDSYHSYEQVKAELDLHASKVSKYIFFHDTTLNEFVGSGGEQGIWPAIQEFLDSHPEWQIVERKTNCNGMTLIKRI